MSARNLVSLVSMLLAFVTWATASDGDNTVKAGASDAMTQAATSQPANWLEFGKSLPHPHKEPATAFPRMVPWTDYTGDLWQRSALTGDWLGLRQSLMDKGIRVNVNLTQTLQGNTCGGVENRGWYQGGLRYELELDTGAAGLWPGGMLHIRGETQYGKNNNLFSGAILPVNTDALYPVPDQDTALSELYYMQFLTPWLGVVAGKMSPRDQNVFSHDETTQFMNTAFNFNPVLGMTVPLNSLSAGAILHPAKWLTLTTLVLDTDGRATENGFDTAFDRGTSIYQMADFAIKPFGQSGHQRVGWTWSDKARARLRQDPRLIFRDIILEHLGLGTGPNLEAEGSDWSFMYDFDQYIYTKPGTKDQGVGVFGRFGFSDGRVNPIGQFYSLGIGGKGMVPGRDNDTFGLGYYYLAVSDKLGPILSRLAEDEQGVELYYNIQITPWMHITPDIQILQPGRSNFSDTAVVAGIRMRIDF